MLVFPVFAIISLKNDPSLWTKNNTSKQLKDTEITNKNAVKTEGTHINFNLGGNNNNGTETVGEKKIDQFNNLTINLLLLAVAIIFIVNFPFKLYFTDNKCVG